MTGTSKIGRRRSSGRSALQRNGQRGYVLVTVIVFVFLIAAIAFLLGHKTSIGSNIAAGELERDELRYVTEAGMRHAQWVADNSTCNSYGLPDTPFGNHSYSALFSPAGGSPVTIVATGMLHNGAIYSLSSPETRIYEPQQKSIFQPDADAMYDTYMDKDSPSSNYGINTKLHVKSGDEARRSLLRFDLDAVPKEAKLASAVLELYSEEIDDKGEVAVHTITNGWVEGTQVAGPGTGASWSERDGGEPWTSQGGDYDPAVLATAYIDEPENQWHQWDITALVESWMSGATINNGLILLAAESSVSATFTSSEGSNSTRHPRLTLTYACECGVSDTKSSLVLQPGPIAGKDTTLHEAGPDNHGVEAFLAVNKEHGPLSNSVLHFDVSSIPAGAFVTSATLALDATVDWYPGSVSVHSVSTSWQEMQANWQNASTGVPWTTEGGDYDMPAADTQMVASSGLVTFDVASIVGSWVQAGATNNGFLLRPASAGVTVEFASSDSSNVGSRPKLTINYACPCGVNCGDDDEGGFCEADFAATNKVFNVKWEPDNKEITGIDFVAEGNVINSVTVPDGGGWIMTDTGEDRLILSDQFGAPLTDFPIIPDRARGIAYVEGGPWAGHLAVADDGDHAIYFLDLDGATVASISTDLIAQKPFGLSFIGATKSNIYDDHLAFSSADNDGDIYIVDQSGVLKKSIDVISYAPDPQGVAHLTGSDKFMVLDETGVVSIIDFDGVLLNQYETATWGFNQTQGIAIHPVSCDHIVVDNKARRVSGFNIEGYQGGFANLLMVISDDNNLTSQEAAKKVLIESWNYLVTIIDDGASQELYDAAAAVHDVVFVGEDIAASNLHDKLIDAQIGVVLEEVNLSDESGISADIGWSSGETINIDDNNHYITLPFATGPLQILASFSSLANVEGTVAPDLQILASESAGPMLVALEAGAERYDSSSSSGRRALLPWGDSSFEVGNLTADGKTVLRRSLDWGTQTPPRCDADFVANNLASDFNWMPGTGDIQGIDYVPAGLVLNSVTVPSGGGWVMNDPNKDRLFVTDIAGNPLTDFDFPLLDSTGVALIDGGQWIHKIAIVSKYIAGVTRIYYLDPDGEIEWSFSLLPITSGNALSLTFIGVTGSAVYDNHLAFTSDKNAAGDGVATVYIVDQVGALQKTIDVEAIAPKPQGISHLPGSDKLLVTDEDGVVSIIDFDGNLVHQYFADQLGITKINNVVIDPTNCNHVMVEDHLKSVVSLARVEPGGSGPKYIEMRLPWSATADDTWEVQNLGIYGVPANAVVEVAVINADGGQERSGGVRAVGSSLDRRLIIHEADGGGMDVMTMHVQADAAGRIEHYSDVADKLSFILLGYWTQAAYVEDWQLFKAGSNSTWVSHELDAYGVNGDDVAEILLVNKANVFERLAGARTEGSSLARILNLHEAKDGGSEMMSLFVVANSDANASIEVYAESDNNIDFYLLGHWGTPPGTFSSAFDDLGTASVEEIWEIKDLDPFGVPAHAVAQIAPVNGDDGSKAFLGARAQGSVLPRLLQLHKARNGGSDLATLHVTTDADAEIEWYDEKLDDIHRFYLLGWWVLAP